MQHPQNMNNPAFTDAAAPYYVQEKRFLFHLVPNGPNVVMDLGCAAGRVGKALQESNKAVELFGVELFAPAAAEAKGLYTQVHVGDIEEMNLPYRNVFDVVLCGDILEHLREPAKVVSQIHQWLKPGGRIVCCVPNIRYWRVCKDLVFRGDWQYASEGIMDQTHLRFFTTKSLRKMLTDASFEIEHEDMRIADGPKQRAFHRLTLHRFKEFLGFQILMSGRKINPPASVGVGGTLQSKAAAGSNGAECRK